MIAPRSGARDAEAVLLAFEPCNCSVFVDAGSLGLENVPHTTSFLATPLVLHVLPVPSERLL